MADREEVVLNRHDSVTTMIHLGQAEESLRLAIAGIHAAMSRTPLGLGMVAKLKTASDAVYKLHRQHEQAVEELRAAAIQRDQERTTTSPKETPGGGALAASGTCSLSDSAREDTEPN